MNDVVVHPTFAGAEATLLLLQPNDLRLPTPRLTVEWVGEVVRITSDTLALSVHLELDGADADWSATFVDLLPGRTREIAVTPWGPMPPGELAARLRWRTL